MTTQYKKFSWHRLFVQIKKLKTLEYIYISGIVCLRLAYVCPPLRNKKTQNFKICKFTVFHLICPLLRIFKNFKP